MQCSQDPAGMAYLKVTVTRFKVYKMGVNRRISQGISHILMIAISASLASLENEDSPSDTRDGKSLLGTFPFNSESVDDLNDHGHQDHNQHKHQDNIAPALPASQDLGAREAKQVRTIAHRKILKKLWIMQIFSGFEQSARQLC